MKEVMVELGGTEYVLTQLPIGASKKWRGKFAEPIEQLLGGVKVTGDLLGKELATGDDVGGVIGTIGGVLLGEVGQTLLGSMELILEMVFEYAAVLRADAERIEAEAYDDEVLLVFWEVLKLAYPFGHLMKIVRGGQRVTRTKRS